MTSKVQSGTGKVKPPNAGKGRVKGVPNKVTKQLKDMILGALDKSGGEAYLVKQAGENPTAFLTLVGKVLPIDMNMKAEVETRIISDEPLTPEAWVQEHAPRVMQ